jgi:CO/xanthine dehydrogenase FAD-binding subunit
MKPPPFDYERPADTDAALASLATHGGRAKVLAGGQSLLPMLNLRLVSPEYLIDVSRLVELKYIRVAHNELRIGALTTHNTVLKSADVAACCPIMVEAYRQVSHHLVRNRGTIGGSLCHNDPAAEMPLVVNLLGALLVARSKNGERVVAADQFFRGHFPPGVAESRRTAARVTPGAIPPINSRPIDPVFRAIDPVFRADSIVLTISVEKDGNLRMVYAWIGRCRGRPAWQGAQAAVARRRWLARSASAVDPRSIYDPAIWSPQRDT